MDFTVQKAKAINAILKGKVTFVGVGNPMKGDDGFGPYVAKKIKGCIDAQTVPENFISAIKKMGPDYVVVFDALDFGGRPGEVKIVDAGRSRGMLLSTHALPLSKFSDLLKPAKVWLIGVQPAKAGFGDGISTEVLESADIIVNEVSRWLNSKKQ